MSDTDWGVLGFVLDYVANVLEENKEMEERISTALPPSSEEVRELTRRMRLSTSLLESDWFQQAADRLDADLVDQE